jgi:hypothetical protein
MNAPTPQPLSATLWNQLLALGDDDRVGLDKINWKLRKLVRDRPADFDARVALSLGLLLSGDRDGGIFHIEAVRGLLRPSDFALTYNFMGLALGVGQLECVRDLLDRLIECDFRWKNETIRNACCAYGIRSGDVEWIDRGIQVTGVEDGDACEFVQDLRRQGLVSAFRRHQELVEAVVAPFSCTFHASIGLDDTGRPMASARYNTSLIGRERLQLYRRIAELKVDPDVIRVSSFISCGILGPQIQSVEVAA